MIGFWTKKDSDNLESIARSLEKLAEREQERSLISNSISKDAYESLMDRSKKLKKPIKVTESTSTEDEALEEAISHSQRMQSKVANAQRTGNVPYVVEDLFDAEELESM